MISTVTDPAPHCFPGWEASDSRDVIEKRPGACQGVEGPRRPQSGKSQRRAIGHGGGLAWQPHAKGNFGSRPQNWDRFCPGWKVPVGENTTPRLPSAGSQMLHWGNWSTWQEVAWMHPDACVYKDERGPNTRYWLPVFDTAAADSSGPFRKSRILQGT